MTEAKNDGGPAFPRKSQYVGEVDSLGMSLRDWYAGQAPEPPGWWMPDGCPTPPPGWSEGDDVNKTIALAEAWYLRRSVLWRWVYADAMIAARGQK